MNSENWLQWMLLAIPNLYLFFMCSTKWNAGTSISAGFLGVLILVMYGWKKQKICWNSSLFLLCYVFFMGSVVLASWLTGDKASFQLSIKFLSYSLPFWLLYLILQQSPSLFQSTFWGMLTGSWVLLALTCQDILHPLKDGRVHASFASANNFAMCLEAILPLLWLETLQVRKEYKNSARGKVLFVVFPGRQTDEYPPGCCFNGVRAPFVQAGRVVAVDGQNAVCQQLGGFILPHGKPAVDDHNSIFLNGIPEPVQHLGEHDHLHGAGQIFHAGKGHHAV